MLLYPEPLAALIEALRRLPGIGPKTAQRLALHLLHAPAGEAEQLARAIMEAREKIFFCSICGNLTDVEPCAFCRDESRDRSLLCVIEWPRDIMAFERTGEYKGLYHVLHGALSPMDGVGPEDLRIGELLARLRRGGVREVILATNPNVEGEATALYLAGLLKPMGLKVTRIAHGLPVGGDLEFADTATLSRSLLGRQEI
ncbi:recombination protein RecR [Thermacetogenium phaeum DSM 12270]|uniref:Recombination protein RecR n=2 Tax=Thermacetogenium phaeum TaxID=85874 RepID=K4LYQ6_THEPS|nr:recombination protein RecR [Thermacetogenium phaeum DSM 12270]KUK36356.1 MAG: Recombination protein RecR [Thermacetogenium phaeum]MDK2881595.1 recombination protein RecR [Clostridia bacterium]MDN5365219.1 recombination protein RecR [Thermacetogenium sp.]MDN5375302.1 recombination protein RecR [Thermacetogenium sp.]